MSNVNPLIEKIENEHIRKDHPEFRVGDTIRVNVKVKEGARERVQVFEGVCIRMRRGGNRATFTVRKMSYGIGVERIFPYHSPTIEKIEIGMRGRVRRAKLYYLRKLKGRAARIREKAFIRK
jgi:large subunit ribosomal protein L19